MSIVSFKLLRHKITVQKRIDKCIWNIEGEKEKSVKDVWVRITYRTCH